MKKVLCLFTAVLTVGFTQAQSIQDALRYSTNNVTGTARYRAMGGAFGALGGDLSAVGDNPASSAVFTRSTFGFTLANDNLDNTTSYFGTTNATTDEDVTFNQIGGVFVWESAPGSKWNKFSFGVNYDRTANFDDQFLASGTGNTSISNYFLDFAQGVPLDLLELRPDETIEDLYQFLGENEGFGAQQAFLGFQSFIIDPTDFDNPNNTTYLGNIEGNQFEQDYAFASSGYNGKASFNLAAQYDEDLHLGVNLNSHFFDYEQSTVYNERNSNPASFVKEVRFENRLRTLGSGFSFQLGAIYKAGDNVRLGLSYDSPTWTTISEEGTQSIRTVAEDSEGEFTTVVDPRVLNVFQDYELKTPGKYTGSIAYLFGSQGLISFDYSYTDYTTTEFRPSSDAFFQQQNAIIDNALTGAASYKIGGEYRIEAWSLRGGYRHMDSPYEDGVTVGDLDGFSAGLGYNFGNIKFDLAYDQFTQDRNQALFSTGLTSAAQIEKTNRSVLATLTFSL